MTSTPQTLTTYVFTNSLIFLVSLSYSEHSVHWSLLSFTILRSYPLIMSLVSLFHYLAICSLNPGFARSLVVPSPDNPQGSTSLIQPSLLIPSWNVSAMTDNSTATKDLLLPGLNESTSLKLAKIVCDDLRFGNPPAASCENAILQIPQDPGTIALDPKRSYGPRGEGNWDVNLPKRYISCKCFVVSGSLL